MTNAQKNPLHALQEEIKKPTERKSTQQDDTECIPPHKKLRFDELNPSIRHEWRALQLQQVKENSSGEGLHRPEGSAGDIQVQIRPRHRSTMAPDSYGLSFYAQWYNLHSHQGSASRGAILSTFAHLDSVEDLRGSVCILVNSVCHFK